MLKSRALRALAWAVGAVVLLILTAWLALPPLLKWQLETRGSELLGRQLSVAEVKFSPFELALTLKQLAMAAAPGGEASAPQLQVERLFVDISARSLLRLAPVIDAIEVNACVGGTGGHRSSQLVEVVRPSGPPSGRGWRVTPVRGCTTSPCSLR